MSDVAWYELEVKFLREHIYKMGAYPEADALLYRATRALAIAACFAKHGIGRRPHVQRQSQQGGQS